MLVKSVTEKESHSVVKDHHEIEYKISLLSQKSAKLPYCINIRVFDHPVRLQTINNFINIFSTKINDISNKKLIFEYEETKKINLMIVYVSR
jgi:hypothetical protein